MTGSPSAPSALAELVVARELDEATRLARAGRLAEADAALTAARSTTAGLDLRARIAAQQNRPEEASARWREAATQMGDPDAFAAELAALHDARGPHRRGIGVRALAGVALAVAVAVAAWAAGRADVEDDVAALRRDTRAALDALADDESRPQAAPGAGAPAPARPAADLEAQLAAVAGAEVTAVDDVLRVRLDDGAFVGGTTLSASGTDTLAALAGALAPHAGGHLVVVTGHTDGVPLRPGSAYGDDAGLRQARARAGADVLLAAGLPAPSVTLGTDASAAPHAGTAPGDPRNRTVTLTVHALATG